MKSLHITIDWRAIIEGDSFIRTEEYHIQLSIQVIGDEDNPLFKNNEYIQTKAMNICRASHKRVFASCICETLHYYYFGQHFSTDLI